ncbi:hypothetical protein A2W45_03935 [Candidatus Curtissbacteria bacterium RIFCSPHIGHO2_12_41_11]|uniref:Uncharacterized protein n=2 Tax=Candidatus Curtissiibacteriota TaxID=1752717 RepID=A0A1F5H9I2_9BACT|nr:MAG: hypothetical protein A3D07_02280 [Candidatus Curtissbacteria bacterium RIFCSPHIGHO2_02_FULL_42_15]OGE00749.1 MAG: hypothetical protein A2W45_03935 [Candidatus Curtissbacteria bacterium RIFCSPHIGHO2_12_41_11]
MLILEGQSLREVRKQLGTQKVSRALRTLRNWGIEIPREKKLSKASLLRTTPVTVLGKPPETIPKISQLKERHDFGNVSNLVNQIRDRRKSGIRLAYLFEDDCPILIYTYSNNRGHRDYPLFLYRLNQKEQLKTYLTKRLRELGLL